MSGRSLTQWHDEDPEGSEFARGVCGLLENYVTRVVPKGAVGRPDASVDVEFLIALIAWERDASDESTARLRIAFFGVMDGWREVLLRHDFRPTETR